MLRWKKVGIGVYKSKDGRFAICRAWSPELGDHWHLHDKNVAGKYKGHCHRRTISDCKAVAEAIVG